MKHLIRAIVLITLSALVSNCAIGPVYGVLFSSTKFPGDINPANDVVAANTATGCAHQVLGLVAFGNASPGSIAQKNNIQRIATVDHSALNVAYFVYSRYCTIVSGQ